MHYPLMSEAMRAKPQAKNLMADLQGALSLLEVDMTKESQNQSQSSREPSSSEYSAYAKYT